MKKNFGNKQKKSYHELVEEQEIERSGFKRSELPKKKPVLILDEIEKPATSFKTGHKKGYLPFDPDRNEKTFVPRQNSDGKRPNSRSANDDPRNSKPYASKGNQPKPQSGYTQNRNFTKPKKTN